MEREPIIPTRIKSKVPRAFSYPIGAEAISDALRGVPQFDQMEIDFIYLNWRGHRHGTSGQYSVISAGYHAPMRYHSMSHDREERECSKKRWSLRVDAVPRALRHGIQTKILTEALPAIRSWLMAHSHSADREGSHGLWFRFDELDNKLTPAEGASLEWQTQKAER